MQAMEWDRGPGVIGRLGCLNRLYHRLVLVFGRLLQLSEEHARLLSHLCAGSYLGKVDLKTSCASDR